MSDMIMHVAELLLQSITVAAVSYLVVNRNISKKVPTVKRQSSKPSNTTNPTKTVSRTVYLHDNHDEKIIAKAEKSGGDSDEW